uniref:Uncharacterized protein n=1 Tax=Eutreptiella gymnastica TaxID=73025 RepID=A0A7S4GEH4_9EUGL
MAPYPLCPFGQNGVNREWHFSWHSPTHYLLAPPRKYGRLSTSAPLPASHKDFVHRTLWERLQLGDRQKEWKPAEVNCPHDGHRETISHALFDCTMLNNAFANIQFC